MSHLHKQAAALRECLVETSFRVPKSVRWECHTPWFVRWKQQGSKMHSAQEQRMSHLQKQYAQMYSNTRAVENIHMAHTFALEST